MPALARILARQRDGKPRGLQRLLLKAARTAFRWTHGRLGLPARGSLALLDPAAPRRFAGNFGNTALIQYARRSAGGGYEPEVSALIDALAPRCATVYDVGANWGYFVALLMTNPGFRGHVHAFEIAPGTFADLAAMVADCGLSERVTCHALGLSDRTGTARLMEEFHSALARIAPEGHGNGREVPVRRLDDLDLPDPDLLKIDVEGHEAEVLSGGRGRLGRAKPIVVLESWYLRDRVERMLEPLRILQELGYSLYQLAWQVELGDTASHLRQRGPRGPKTLALLPLTLEQRSLIPAALNLAAVHSDRRSLLVGS